MCRGEGAASAKGLRQVLPSQACAGDQGVSVRLETGGAGCLLADVGAKAGERHLTWSTWSYTGCVGCSRSSLLCAGSLAVESRGSCSGFPCRGARLSVPGLQHLQHASSVVSARWLWAHRLQ